MTSLSVIMPAYNEAATIATVVDDVLALRLDHVELQLVIVESSSTDGTGAIVDRYAADPRVLVRHQATPRGKGNAVREGLREASGEIVLIQDADLEYTVDDYPALLEPILAHRADFVLGCRHVPGQPMRVFDGAESTSRLMNVGHWIFTWLFNAAYGTRLRDPFTMYKVFRRECIDGLELVSDRFDFDWELVAKLARRGYKPLEVDVTYKSRGFEAGKKVRVFRDPLTWIAALVRFRLVRIAPKAAASVATSDTRG